VIQGVLILFVTAKITMNWWKVKKKAGDIHGAA
jgi:hypothetical protein